jgi:hypothetical protein
MLMIREYSAWARALGVEGEPPLDRASLMRFGHAPVVEQVQPHWCDGHRILES